MRSFEFDNTESRKIISNGVVIHSVYDFLLVFKTNTIAYLPTLLPVGMQELKNDGMA